MSVGGMMSEARRTYWERTAKQSIGEYTITRDKCGMSACYPWVYRVSKAGVHIGDWHTITAAKKAMGKRAFGEGSS